MAKQAKQIPLDLPHKPSFEMADFIVSASNEAAYAMVEGWPEWPHHAIAVCGPKACGKTHLAQAWAKKARATEVDASQPVEALERGVNILVDGADREKVREDTLFHLFNWTKETGGSLLLTGEKAPNLWRVTLPDLRSRLATIPVAEIQTPDDHLLMVLLVKLFSDRQLQVDLSVIDYVLPRIERSFDAVMALVDAIDRHALADKRKITRPLAKACLEELSVR